MYDEVVFGCPFTNISPILDTSTPVPNIDVVNNASAAFGYGWFITSKIEGSASEGVLPESSNEFSSGSNRYDPGDKCDSQSGMS